MKQVSKFLAASIAAASIFQCMGSVPVLADKGVRIDSTNFPDDNFRAVIATTYDLDGNGYIGDYEVNHIYNIVCEGKGIKSLKGIEYFTQIRGLWCRQNQISYMDISNNKELTGVWCSENLFTSLDFTPNPKLEWVYCFDCRLTSLNVRNNEHMAYLEASTNPNLKSIDVTQNEELEHLMVASCGLTSLDVSHNPKLSHLDAQKNNLGSLDLSNNKKMKRLDIWDNPRLGNSVNISGLKDLEYYCCAANNVTVLDVSHNPHLMKLNCSYNYIKKLDLSNNPDLAWLSCGRNEISSLDLSNNPKLYYCLAFTNPFTTLNIGNNSRLLKVYNDGYYQDEPLVCQGYSMTLDYGGSHEYFDELEYCLCVDYKCTVDTTHKKGKESYDSYVDARDGLSTSDDLITREVAIQTLYRLAGSPSVSGLKTRFTDVKAGSWYENAVKWGEANDICFGYPNICSDTFGVGQYITREDLALMIHRYAEYKGFSSAFDYGRTDNFSDFFKMDYYAWGAMTFAIQWEILKPRGSYIYPHGRVTYSELTAGLNNLLELNYRTPNAQVAMPLGKPTLESVLVTEKGISLSWSKVNGADGYNIYRSTSENGTYEYVKSVKGSQSTTDTTAKPGQKYYYKVRAYMKDGQTFYSRYSNAGSVTYQSFSSFAITVKSSVTIGISWSRVPGAVSYDILYAPVGGNYNLAKTAGKTQTSTSHTGLSAGTRYRYKIIAKNGAGNPIAISPVREAVTLGPTSLQTVQLRADGSISLSWNKVGGTDRYNVYRSTTGESGSFEYYASVLGGTSFVDKNTAPGQKYYYQVQAYKKIDGKTYYGERSAVGSVTYRFISNFKVAPKSGVTMTLSWGSVSGAYSYDVMFKEDGGAFTLVKSTGSSQTSTSHTGLTAGKRYSYMIIARNKAGKIIAISDVRAAVTLS